jgi:centromere protein C
VYDKGRLDGKNISLPGIKEVIRTEEIIETRPKRPGKKRAPQKTTVLEEVEEEDEDTELWELEPGILRAEVLHWDPVLQRGVEENVGEVGKSARTICPSNV